MMRVKVIHNNHIVKFTLSSGGFVVPAAIQPISLSVSSFDNAQIPTFTLPYEEHSPTWSEGPMVCRMTSSFFHAPRHVIDARMLRESQSAQNLRGDD